MAKVVVGSRSSSTRIGDIETPSSVDGGAARDGDAGFPDAARGDGRAGFVEQRDLAELAELQDVVLENAVLLRLRQARVLQIGGERLEELGVGRDVAADFLGGAGGDVQVALDDRSGACRAGATCSETKP